LLAIIAPEKSLATGLVVTATVGFLSRTNLVPLALAGALTAPPLARLETGQSTLKILFWSYLAYLLRLWPTGDRGSTIWRASLESPHSGERYNFATLEEMFSFLQRETRQLTVQAESEKP
jgi:hypothetical protein